MSTDLRFSSAIAPRPVVLTTTAVVAVGVVAVGAAAGSPAPLLGAASGALLAVALSRMGRDPLLLRSYAAGVAALLGAAFLGTVALAVALGSPTYVADFALVGALWLAAFDGVGAGRGVLSSQSLTRGFVGAFAALVGIGVAFPIVGIAAAALSGVGWLLTVHAGRPAVGTLLALCAGACFAVGLALRSTPGDADARRPINRQLRARAADATTAGVWLLFVGAVTGIVGGAGGYALLESLAPPLWALLAIVTSSPLVRAVPLAVAALAALAPTARRGLAWAWTEDGLDVARAGALLSGVGGVVLLIVTVVAATSGIGPSFGWHPGFGNSGVAAGLVVLALLGTATGLFALRMAVGSDRRAATPLYLCIFGLLSAATVLAVTRAVVIAPIAAVAAASIVWDVGRVGATMGAELGEKAEVRRGALVRIGGSVVVGALGALAAIVLAAGAERIGGLLDGPVVLTLSGAVALVVALSWYARKRETPAE